MIQLAAELCHCGRPLRHAGRCKGFDPVVYAAKKAAAGGMIKAAKPVKPDEPAKPAKARLSGNAKLRVMVEEEIKRVRLEQIRLRGVIEQARAELLNADAKLTPLRALLDVYRDLALPAPAAPRAEPVDNDTKTTVVDISPGTAWPDPEPVQVHDNDDATDVHLKAIVDPVKTEDDFAPIAVDFNQLVAWASVRNLPFRSWDDLPAINRRRESFDLPPFKRAYGKGKP